jgi:hypothetical protein
MAPHQWLSSRYIYKEICYRPLSTLDYYLMHRQGQNISSVSKEIFFVFSLLLT